jgi:DNA ligase-1
MERIRIKIEPEHQLLLLIGNEPKTSLKKKALKKYKGSRKLQNIFKYTLDPFRKYYIKKIPRGVVGKGSRVINEVAWEVLDTLATREITGEAAKLLLFTYMEDLTKSECILMKKIVRHKLGIGVSVKTVNDVWKNLILENPVQKAEDWDPTRITYPCYGSVKMDGIRATYKNGVFTARSGHTIPGLEHISRYLQSRGVFAQYDGELIIPGTDFDTASGIIRSGKDKRQVHYVIFDMPGLLKVSLSSRYQLLSTKIDRYHTTKCDYPASYLYHRILRDENEVMQFYNQCLYHGEEGVMVKNLSSHYEAKRNYNWMKLKKYFEDEFVIIDFFEGEGKYKGMLGGFIVITEDNIKIRVGGGFSDEARVAMWADHSFLGKLCTVTAMEKTRVGSLRHPVYKNVRWDLGDRWA